MKVCICHRYLTHIKSQIVQHYRCRCDLESVWQFRLLINSIDRKNALSRSKVFVNTNEHSMRWRNALVHFIFRAWDCGKLLQYLILQDYLIRIVSNNLFWYQYSFFCSIVSVITSVPRVIIVANVKNARTDDAIWGRFSSGNSFFQNEVILLLFIAARIIRFPPVVA